MLRIMKRNVEKFLSDWLNRYPRLSIRVTNEQILFVTLNERLKEPEEKRNEGKRDRQEVEEEDKV